MVDIPVIVTPTAELLPPGVGRGVIESRIDLSTAAAYFTIGTRPIGSGIVSLAVDVPNTLSATTAVKFGIGNASDPDAYYRSAGLTTASSTRQILLHADTNITTAESIRFSAVDTNGAAAGTIGGGSDDYVRVRITYLEVKEI